MNIYDDKHVLAWVSIFFFFFSVFQHRSTPAPVAALLIVLQCVALFWRILLHTSPLSLPVSMMLAALPLPPGCPPDTSWWLRESLNNPLEQCWSHLLSLLSLPSHPGTRLYRQRDMRNVTPREVISLARWRLWHCCAPLSGASTKRAFAIYNSVLLKFLTQVPWCETTSSHLLKYKAK